MALSGRDYHRVSAATAASLGEGTRAAYLAVRGVAGTMHRDRILDEDIRKMRELVERGGVSPSGG